MAVGLKVLDLQYHCHSLPLSYLVDECQLLFFSSY